VAEYLAHNFSMLFMDFVAIVAYCNFKNMQDDLSIEEWKLVAKLKKVFDIL
jgi:hypothetical protein